MEEEIKTNNLDSVPGKIASSDVPPPAAGEENIFFNIMPKVKNTEGMVQPTAGKTGYGPAAEGVSAERRGAGSRYKWYMVVILILVACGFGIYFVLGKIGNSLYKPENFLAQQAPSSGTSASSSTPESNASQADFTTDQKWRDKYFPGCTDASLCGDSADPDHDGLTNLQEFKLGTDPNNNDSDQDGLSDGDEYYVFGTDPLNSHTANDLTYNDADYFKGGYDIGTGKKMTGAEIADVSAKMQKYGLHEPTVKTLYNYLNSLYNFSGSTTPDSSASTSPDTSASSSVLSNFDQSVAGKQGRDTQRSSTIQNIEIGLVSYYADNKTYPITNDFPTMFANIKPYLKVATNPLDPINASPYVYGYSSKTDGSDFELSFYSEVAGQVIAKNAADAAKDASAEQAAVYDNQRETDLESLRTALLLYSQNNIAGTQTYVFPSADKYQTAIVPEYINAIPKDPKTGADYVYQVSTTFDTFTLKAVFDAPAPGTTGYLCNQEECSVY